MALKPGYKIPVGVTTTSAKAAAGDRLPGVKSLGYPISRVVIDGTNAKDAAADASRRSVLGLFDNSKVTIELQWDPADANCLRLQASLLNGSSVWIQYTADNTWGAGTGFSTECVVNKIDFKPDLEGALTASVEASPNGAPALLA